MVERDEGVGRERVYVCAREREPCNKITCDFKYVHVHRQISAGIF